jgi:hypothetical protein
MSDDSLEFRWQSNIKQLITEELTCNSLGGQLTLPWKITYLKLLEVADAAVRINDPTLNLLMCELALYTVGDGYHEDYNPDTVDKVRKAAIEFQKGLK